MDVQKEERLWSLPISSLLGRLKTSEKGLLESEVQNRLKLYGHNEIIERKKRVLLHILISQFKNALVLVLIAASAISYMLGQHIEAAVIISIVLLNTILGFTQEYKAEKALRELHQYITVHAKVKRENQIKEIDARNVVKGDVVYVTNGDIIPADIRLIYTEDLYANEATLTGESLPVLKKSAIIQAHYDLPPQLHNIAFMGTSVVEGEGYGIVINTAKDTFFGKTAGYVQTEEHVGDFQKSIHAFSNFLLKIILIMTLFVFVANAVLHKGIFDSFLFALALAVGITPEVLPIIMTITLSNGALKMAREKVVIKKLSSVEEFGNIDTLCCDKTGTLTEGEHSLQDYVDLDGNKNTDLVLYGLLCSSAVSNIKDRKTYANPIDKALWDSKIKEKVSSEMHHYTLLSKNEFDYERKRMGVAVKSPHGNMMIVKGAPELVLKVCSYATINGKKVITNSKIKQKIKQKIIAYEQDGYKVIAVAQKSIHKTKISDSDEHSLTLIGFLLFLDPPKRSVKDSLARLQKLGVNIKIISGDSAVITRKICKDVGLKISENRVITGEELEKLSEMELEEYSQKYNVFARVTPQQKFMIVDKLNRENHIVGYLGDGVNDVPALKAADVGITVDSAVGIAKESADIILLNKSLEVLADGIVTGRKTFGNITKYILNTISANYGNMFTVAISSLFMKFIPLLPAQILLNNFISDVPNLAIASDNVDESLLKKPKRWNLKLIYRFMVFFGLISTFFDLLLIMIMLYILHLNEGVFRTAWFAESVLSEIVVVFAIRTAVPFWESKPSKWLIIFSILSAVFAVAITYMKWGKELFAFVSMEPLIWGLIGLILIAYFSTVEVAKQYFFKKFEM